MDCDTFQKLALAEWRQKKQLEDDAAKRRSENEYEAVWQGLKAKLPLLEKLPPNRFRLCGEEFRYSIYGGYLSNGEYCPTYYLESPFGSVNDAPSFGAFLERKAEVQARNTQLESSPKHFLDRLCGWLKL